MSIYAVMSLLAWSMVSHSARHATRFLNCPKPRLDERLRFGVAVTAAAVADVMVGEVAKEPTRRELGAVVGADRQPLRPHVAANRPASTQAMASSVRHRRSKVHAAISRVQQSMITCR